MVALKNIVLNKFLEVSNFCGLCSVRHLYYHFSWRTENASGFGMQLCFGVRMGTEGFERSVLVELEVILGFLLFYW